MTSPIGSTSGTAPLFGATPLSQVIGAPATGATPAAPGKDLDKDAFLKLLVAQLKYQDPSNPAQGTEFLAQTATFTEVEKLTDLVDQETKMLTAQLSTSAASMIGRTVTYLDASGNTSTGLVTGAALGTSPSVQVNGVDVPMDKVTRVAATGAAPPPAIPPAAAGTPAATAPAPSAPAPSAPIPGPPAQGTPTAGGTAVTS